MIDSQIQGASWIEIPKGTYSFRESPTQESTSCQVEIDVWYDKLVAHQPEGDWSRIAPLRILSFDIECAGRKGVFPDPQIDPVIQIANMVTVQGESQPCIRNVFTLNTCANIAGTHTLSFETEQELLKKWQQFVETVDPDIIIGYNINGFDFPYLLDRAETLKVTEFPFLGRVKGESPFLKTFSSSSIR